MRLPSIAQARVDMSPCHVLEQCPKRILVDAYTWFFTKCFRLLLFIITVSSSTGIPISSTQFWMLTSYWNVPIVAAVKGLIEALLSEDGFSADDIFGSSTSMLLGFDVDHTLFSSRPCHSEVPNFSPSCFGITWNCTKFRIGFIPVFRCISTISIPQKDGQIYHHPQRVHIKLLNLWGYPHHKKNQGQPPVSHLPMRKQITKREEWLHLR